MGGVGSGQWYRWDKKATCEEIKRIDIRYLKRQGWLYPGYQGWLSWVYGGEPSGSIRIYVYDYRVVLKYRYRAHGEDWQSVEETVWLEKTACNYGGYRIWFQCPRCGERVAVLYGADIRFLCRNCYGLSYASQQEGFYDRMLRKARKVRANLGVSEDLSEPICSKPKHMHQRTFERLSREAERAEEMADNVLAIRLVQLGMTW